MKENKSSITAKCTAMYRAAEFLKPEHERLCSDKYAKSFMSPLVRTIFKSRCLTQCFLWLLFERKMPGAVTAVLARVRYIDDYLAAGIRDGYRQVIILGAGYDTRAYRFDLLHHDIRFFELDHPMTQQEKKYGVRKIFGVLPRHVVYVPIDFENEGLLEKLNAKGYDETLKTLFIWEGVTKYLSQEAVESVLAFVAKHSTEGSSIIFDYVYRSILSGNASKYQDKVNEPFRFGIEKSTLSMYIAAQGFSKVDNIALHDLKGLFDCAKRRRWPNISFGGIACATV